jgi:ribosomal protein S18 acetylase RimI-like enzyme
MASVSSPSVAPGPGEDVVVQRVDRADRRPALGVLLTGRPEPYHALVEQFLSYSRDQNLSLNELYAAYRGQAPVAAVLVLPNAGRSGMVFASPVHDAQQAALAGRVVDAAAQAQDPQRMGLLQALVEPEQPLTLQALEAGGFERLATLQYMGRPADLPVKALDLGDAQMSAVTWSEAHRPLFASAIEASYEATADCPGLVGLRRIEDIIAGHIAAGRFEPMLWLAVQRQGQPVAVMLINQLIHQPGYELVYLGVAAPFRGQGVARRLLSYGLGQASQRSHETDNPRLHLAVDEANAAARQLYADFGFRTQSRKLAMIRPLG